MNSEKIVENFNEHLASDGKSPKTVMSYVGDVKGFVAWLEQKTSFDGNLTRFYITSYKSELMEKNYEVNTINKKINSLYSFNLFLMSAGLCHEKVVYPNKDKVKVARGSEGEVEVFSDEEVEKILFYLERNKDIRQRDKLCVYLLLFSGIRVSELVCMKIKNIDLLSLSLKVVGKGGKYREIPMKTEVVQVVKEYLEGERRDHKHRDSEYLLLSQRSERLDKDTVNKLLRKHGRRLGLILYPHKFRHTFCTRLLKRGVELTTVAKLAGHANIQTTASFYINTSKADKQEAVNLL